MSAGSVGHLAGVLELPESAGAPDIRCQPSFPHGADCGDNFEDISNDSFGADWATNSSAGGSGGSPPSSLVGALRVALLTEHSLFPLCRGGVHAMRAALRLAATLAMALGACEAVRAPVVPGWLCVSPENAPICLAAAAGAAWAVAELEVLAQWALRHRMGARSGISSFDPGEVLDVTDVDMMEDNDPFDSSTLGLTRGLWEPIEEGHEAQDDGGTATAALPLSAADLIAEQLMKEYSRLAPGMPATVTAAPMLGEAGPAPATGEVAACQPPEAVPSTCSERPRRLPSLGGRGGGWPAAPTHMCGIAGSPLALMGPTAKVAGDAATHRDAPVRPGSSMSNRSMGDQSLVSLGDRSLVSGRTERTGISSGGVSGAASSVPTSMSSRSAVSVLSLNRNRNAPNMNVRQQCDLETLKLNYIQSITAKREVQVDQRLDCRDVQLAAATLDGRGPSLGIAAYVLLVSVATSLGLCIGLGHRDLTDCWVEALWEAMCGWLFAVLVLDFVTVLAIAAVQFRLLQVRLAARLDQRWKRVEIRRAQKAETMRRAAAFASTAAAAKAVADTDLRGEAKSAAGADAKFDQHLNAFIAGAGRASGRG